MLDKIDAPLLWPSDKQRTREEERRASPFQTTLAAACADVRNELRLLEATEVVVSANGPGVGDPGVAVYFQRLRRTLCLACDRWLRVQDNVYAIALTVRALRGVSRWGTADMAAAVFDGFGTVSGPPPRRASVLWWQVLGVQPRASTRTIATRYRELVFRHHPDRGGDPQILRKINRAFAEFQQATRQKEQGN